MEKNPFILAVKTRRCLLLGFPWPSLVWARLESAEELSLFSPLGHDVLMNYELFILTAAVGCIYIQYQPFRDSIFITSERISSLLSIPTSTLAPDSHWSAFCHCKWVCTFWNSTVNGIMYSVPFGEERGGILGYFIPHGDLEFCPCCGMCLGFCCWVVFHSLDVPHFIYSFACWWTLGCFHFLAITNEVAVTIWVQDVHGQMFPFLLCVNI